MLNSLLRLFERSDNRRGSRPDQAGPPIWPTPDTRPINAPSPLEHQDVGLSPVNTWSHPFKDRNHPLLHLTQLAKATAGYFPLGRNGLWHGGVHFDAGTASQFDQSSVHCLADGEVVAYRIDQHAPTTAYQFNKLVVNKPFSRNFVLVRHLLQPPKIKGSPDTPPSLIIYSLYMHLQDWAAYQQDPALTRPGFWPEGQTRWVKETVQDIFYGRSEQRGLNVRNMARQGKVLTFLPAGAAVTVSGDGEFRKLENTLGPEVLIDAEGALRGYLSAYFLELISANQYRVRSRSPLNVRAEANLLSEILLELPPGTEVTISGEGEFRKLERVNQYVHYPSLRGELEPLAHDRVVVLDEPVPIKAGDLIGHIGEYQSYNADRPENKLHLEVFSEQDARAFLKASRAWAERLPKRDKTWLKLAKGTPVLAHQDDYNTTRPPHLARANRFSDADLLVPKSLLDDLPDKYKIAVFATPERKAQNWYRLDGLLNDGDNAALDGWVCEEVGVTPWVNPWSWDGYEVIFDYSSPREHLASFHRAVDRFSGAQLERYGPMADAGDKGPVQRRLFDIIDRNHDGKMTAEELQTALNVPAHAQSISQLIVLKESEWFHRPQKWDALDELLGHSGSTPHVNWLAEKERIKALCWWDEVMEKVGLPEDGKVYHFHPVGIGDSLNSICPAECVVEVHKLESSGTTLVVSKESFDFILEQEGYREYPYVPAGASGVTLGYGYDLGQQTPAQVRQDLSGLYTWLEIQSLLSAIGKRGDEAISSLNAISHIAISKDDAASLALRMKLRYAQLVLNAYPQAASLHPHCQGALLSLVINRGISFTRPSVESRLEMKQISDDLINLTPESIPSRLRSMKRLWEGQAGLGGLIIRREEEAKLFEKGLACDCWH
jgi:GH24 family phage-related lysozyme (muramidase)